MTLKMIAVLRLMMPDINIAAATALETLHPEGRLVALRSGANVAMPNLTPAGEGSDYRLYDNKPASGSLDTALLDFKPGTKGDPLHFEKLLKKSQH
jgi:biotin synthase